MLRNEMESAGKLSRLTWKPFFEGSLDPLQIEGFRNSLTTHRKHQPYERPSLSIKQRLYPTSGQASVLREHQGQVRFVWNRMLHLRKNKIIQPREMTGMLSTLRGTYDWLGAGPSVSHQRALRDLQDAYDRHYENPKHFELPTLKKRHHCTGVFLRDLKVRRLSKKWGETFIPKLGWVRFRITRLWADIARAKTARITRTPGGAWHVAFTLSDRPPFPRTPTGTSVGIDLGGTITATTFTSGQEVSFTHIPGLTAGERGRYLALERKMAQQERGSRRNRRTRELLGRITDRLRHRRRDWIEQTTTSLVRSHDFIAMERLNTSGMVRKPYPVPDLENPGQFLPNGAAAKAGLNKLIYASNWGLIRERLTDKAARAGVELVLVHPANTSRECAECRHIAKENRESQAGFLCVKCGHTDNADANAARNILAKGKPPRKGYAAGHAVNGRTPIRANVNRSTELAGATS